MEINSACAKSSAFDATSVSKQVARAVHSQHNSIFGIRSRVDTETQCQHFSATSMSLFPSFFLSRSAICVAFGILKISSISAPHLDPNCYTSVNIVSVLELQLRCVLTIISNLSIIFLINVSRLVSFVSPRDFRI